MRFVSGTDDKVDEVSLLFLSALDAKFATQDFSNSCPTSLRSREIVRCLRHVPVSLKSLISRGAYSVV
jgi:hypothetical protein